MKISLGLKVVDTVTGFTGIATAKVEYINGCIQFCVQPEIDKDGKLPSGEYIDHQRLEPWLDTNGQARMLGVTPKNIGGPQRDALRGTYRG